MSEEMKEEMKKLKEELANLKEKLGEMTERTISRPDRFQIDLGERVHSYVEDILESVMEGISGELERSVLIGPESIKVVRRKRAQPEAVEVDPVKAASIMSSLGNEYRLRVLGQLISGGKYISELQERLHEITSSTLSSHLGILEEAGLVLQEKVRGRYLITIPGRMAYNMANHIAKLVEQKPE